MRLWAKNLMDNPLPKREQMTTKDKILTIISIIVEATIIGLLVLTLVVNSCQICYTTSSGVSTYKQCKSISDIMDNGIPNEMKQVYEGKTSSQMFIDNATHYGLNGTDDWLKSID